MQKKLSFTCSLLLLNSVLSAPSFAAGWFTGQDVYTVAHQRLLEGKTTDSFGSIVQAWQQQPDETQQDNLNQLLRLAITEDCGRSLSQVAMPDWLPNLAIQREVIQSVNQTLLKLSINGTSRTELREVRLSRWPDLDLIVATPSVAEGGYFNAEARRLEAPVEAGLYQLTITTAQDETLNQWVVLTSPSAKQRIGWKDSKNWRIEQGGLPNPACPSEVLSMSLYDLNDTSWTPLWTENVDGRLPTTLPEIDVADGRYWLSVGLIESRWQGSIAILDIQRITRPVDYPGF
ncbi:DUF2861 family protein [Photobacterium atrarenae]|uniref:DUF2861 family protein n=1 Tax=Photobacterium atrarenae TaxID=865757 RepID=A0ABY5GL62_9GAMM|nr:DUF2861 family protein [Photobacterium atrarenae]UTV30053.1 DUF2861 family protein [Photobacterium atrarenae]